MNPCIEQRRTTVSARLIGAVFVLFLATGVGAAPVFIQGYGLNQRGVNQGRPTYCAPAVGYLMAQYGESRGLDLLKDGAAAIDQIRTVANLMRCNLGASPADIVAGVRSMYGGYLVDDGKARKYPNAWSQLRERGRWNWNDVKARIGQSLPIMLGVEGVEAGIDHVVFAYGYEEINPGAANAEYWIFLLDTYADQSGTDTSRNPKKWKIRRDRLEILLAVDALSPDVAHLDVDGKPYRDRDLLVLITGGSAAPAPGSLALLVVGLAAWVVARRGRQR